MAIISQMAKLLTFSLIVFQVTQAQVDICNEPEDCKELVKYVSPVDSSSDGCDFDMTKFLCPCTCSKDYYQFIKNPLLWRSRSSKFVEYLAPDITSEPTLQGVRDKCDEMSVSYTFANDVCGNQSREIKINDEINFVRVSPSANVKALDLDDCISLCGENREKCTAMYVGKDGTDRSGECYPSSLELNTINGNFRRMQDLELWYPSTDDLCSYHTCTCIPHVNNPEKIGELDCSFRNLTSYADSGWNVPNPPTVLGLNLRGNPIRTIMEDDLSAVGFYKIKTLDVSNCNLRFIQAQAFGRLTKLEVLLLNDNPLTLPGFGFDTSKNLSVFQYSLRKKFSSVTNLKMLDISNTLINGIDDVWFSQQGILTVERLVARDLPRSREIAMDAFDNLAAVQLRINNTGNDTDAGIDYGGSLSYNGTVSNCFTRGSNIFCECADSYGPGWWRDDQEIAHYGCTQQNPAADAPEIAATPVLSETGNDAFMTVSVKLENTTTNAYLTLTDGGPNWFLCCEPEEERKLRPLKGVFLDLAEENCPPEGVPCEGTHQIEVSGLQLGADLSFIVISNNAARIPIRGVESESVQTPNVEKDEQSVFGQYQGEIIGGIVAFIILVVLLALYIRRRIRLRPVSKQSFADLLQSLKSEGFIAENEYQGEGHYDRVPTELSRSALKMISVLGSGAFGEVRRAILVDNYNKGYPSNVAVKVTKPGATEDRDEFLREAVISAQFDHDNIVKLIGVVTSGEPLLMVIELCDLGSLKDFLVERSETGSMKAWGLTLEQSLTVCKQTAKGLGHLSAKKFVHRDIASRNVLVTSSHLFKIADFGLGRQVNDAEEAYYKADRRGPLPVRWCSPEALNDQRFSMASDVWAWGVMAYEIFTFGATPYDGLSNHQVWVKVSDGHRLERPDACPEEIWDEIVMPCFDADASHRPSFNSLVAKLEIKEPSETTFDPDYMEIIRQSLHEYASVAPAPNLAPKDDTPEYEYSAAVIEELNKPSQVTPM